MDRERDDRRGPRRRGARPAAARSRRRRATARRTGCGSSRTTRTAYDWYYNVVSNPTLWFLQHYLWGLAETPERRPRARTTPGRRATSPVNAGVRRGRARRARGASPTRPSSSTTTTSTSRRGSCASGAPDAHARALRPHPVAAAGLLARAAATRSARARARRAARERRRRLPHATAGAGTSCAACEDLVGAQCDCERGIARYDGRRRRSSPRIRSRSTRASSRSCATSAAVLEAGAAIVEHAARAPRPPRRPHRPVEERRPRLPRVRALPRRRTRSCTGGSGCSRCSTRRGRTSPSTPSTSARSSATARAVNDRFQRDGWTADRPPDRGQLPAVGRGVQAVRRAARERDLRRA